MRDKLPVMLLCGKGLAVSSATFAPRDFPNNMGRDHRCGKIERLRGTQADF
jgi:hypothetical protein